jgi:hypothetical protein
VTKLLLAHLACPAHVTCAWYISMELQPENHPLAGSCQLTCTYLESLPFPIPAFDATSHPPQNRMPPIYVPTHHRTGVLPPHVTPPGAPAAQVLVASPWPAAQSHGGGTPLTGGPAEPHSWQPPSAQGRCDGSRPCGSGQGRACTGEGGLDAKTVANQQQATGDRSKRGTG